MQQASTEIYESVKPVIEALGYELVGIEYVVEAGNNILRIYIDQDNGIAVEDCELVSNQVSATLDVSEPITTEYFLEVSSPGLDRPLFTLQHFMQFKGTMVRIEMLQLHQGRRKFKGLLQGVEDNKVLVELEQQLYYLPFNDIKKARLVPVF